MELAALKKLLQKKAYTVQEIATREGVDVRTVYYWIKRLEDQGVDVYREGRARPTRYRVRK